MKYFGIVSVIFVSIFVLYFAMRSGATSRPDLVSSDTSTVSADTDGSPTPLASLGEKSGSVATEISLTISAPANGSTVKNASIQVKGTSTPLAEIFVNEKEGKADASGNFSIPVVLDEGENYLFISANDVNGNVSETDITVTYSP